MAHAEKWYLRGWNVKTNRPFGYTDIVAHLGDSDDQIADVVCEKSSCVERAKRNGRLIAKAPEMERLLRLYAAPRLLGRPGAIAKLERESHKILEYIIGKDDECPE